MDFETLHAVLNQFQPMFIYDSYQHGVAIIKDKTENSNIKPFLEMSRNFNMYDYICVVIYEDLLEFLSEIYATEQTKK